MNKTPAELAQSLRTMFAARREHMVAAGQGPAWSIIGTADRFDDLLAAARELDTLASDRAERLQPVQLLPDGTLQPVFCGAYCTDEALCRESQACHNIGAATVGLVNVSIGGAAPVQTYAPAAGVESEGGEA